MTRLTPADIADLERLLAAATPGPWILELGRMTPEAEVFGFGIFPSTPTINLPPNIHQHSLASANLYEHSAFGAFYPPDVIEANAALIVALRNTIDALLAERKEREEALREIAEWKGYKIALSENDSSPQEQIETAYENGANDMLEGLALIARAALTEKETDYGR